MTRGTSPRFGMHTSTSVNDTISTQDLFDNYQQLEQLGAIVLPPGARSARPAPGVSGRLYKAIDTGELFLDTGSQWLYASGTAAATWVGTVTHTGTGRALATQPSGTGGKYTVHNKWVSGACTIMADSQATTAGQLVTSLPLPVDRAAHPVRSVLGQWALLNDNSEWSMGSLIIGGTTVVAHTTWRGVHDEFAGVPNSTTTMPGYGTGGALQATIDVGDTFSWSFGYFTP